VRGRDLAAEYERRYPETGVSEAQKQERMERILHREERSTGLRTHRSRGIIVPHLPWVKEGAA
jgi:hypothetical protein